MERTGEQKAGERVPRLAEHLNETLSPFEPTIMKVQSLLVWEKPVKSAIMIAIVHGIFWFFLYGGCRFFSTLSTVIMVLYFLRTWKKKIWPEIRLPPKIPDMDEWTPVHPRLLSVPELSQYVASQIYYLENCARWWTTLRKERPLKFCIETCFICGCLAMLGHYISGGMLSYIIIMSGILWPCLQYHNLLKKFYMKFEPYFMRLDYSMKVKSKWRFEGDKAPILINENTDDEGHLATSQCADNESDLEDFYPTDPALSAALARAITDSEDEGGTPNMPLTPRMSKEPSVANSDEENNVTDDTVNDFTPSIDIMPSFEDSLDHTDDELLGIPDERKPPRISRESSADSMRFIPSHFEDSDIDEGDQMVPGRVEIDTDAAAREIVSQAFASVMGSAIKSSFLGQLQNLQNLASGDTDQNTGKRQASRETEERFASTYSDSEDETLALSDHARRDVHKEKKDAHDDTASLDIEEEFDFLDEYELGSSVEK
ncbi:reticulophagy regulator 3-like [Mya arenaria]|uniref:reticulophagy regulator 3-like n=1 Tax=Mya arenaria TaxID=6604 RepID=UPI0022E0F1C7|nr:reticulophagy regulator 3-like [Mya arenaria]